MSKSVKTFNEQMLDIISLYENAGGGHPYDLDELGKFAIQHGHWEQHGNALLQQCKKDFSRALREQYHTDPQGREIRTFHAVKKNTAGTQQVFWDDMRDAPIDHMQLAFHQRRTQIVGDCCQLKRDVDSYNENNSHGDEIQLLLDFRDDVAEREQSVEYSAP